MKYVKLALSLAFFTPIFALFGAESWGGYWIGWVVGGMIGVFFGLVFGGNPDWKIWNPIFGPKQPEEEEADKPTY